jgi:hypothetical protein
MVCLALNPAPPEDTMCDNLSFRIRADMAVAETPCIRFFAPGPEGELT